nr:histidine kinase [Devosia oryzisoli]
MHSIARWWRKQNLTVQFVISACVVMIAATIPTGLLIGDLAEKNALYHRAAATALFMDNVVAPYLQSPAGGAYSASELEQIDVVLNKPSLMDRIPHFEVWQRDGTILYSRSRPLVGVTFPLPAPAARAFEGEVEVSIADLGAGEHQSRGFKTRYLEIYAPLHELGTGRILAVMELHEDVEVFAATAHQVRMKTWLVVLAAMAALFGCMFLIVRRGARTIDLQTAELSRQLETTHRLAERNAELHGKAVESAKLRVQLHENLLRSFGADLHDGPAQLLAYASLKVESARRARNKVTRDAQLADLEVKLREAQDDIRDMASGLVLPEIDQLSLDTVVEEALSFSERRFGVSAQLVMENLKVSCSRDHKMCLYRFLQEGLNNVWNHGTSEATFVTVELREHNLFATVRNRVAAADRARRARRGLGVTALKVRAESLGGSVSLAISHHVAELRLVLPLREDVDA